ncbi:MAG: ABC transporter substrate-binding protein [Candidatus Cloacimonetes bacterium]|nr:ABC transporter substrate-binding protein [Candidatus Cloacimonadota bacterium]MCF7814801.1 ABC transporter substrate-binding protein [Candidatus Cloacimonadota bacterium]MCF7869204.1 ABC transporter substrate-binding protein [Candidatus Cloacimonadota bacterium]MCF7884631.1 ABC transporter substrate-binding protein [Candidatus Cloacimonadota bacterium]
MKKIISILITVLLFSCSTNQKEKLVVGIIAPSLNHLPIKFGMQFGILKGKDIVIKKFSSGWETNEALIAEKIDVAIMPFTYIWSDVSQGKKVKIISFLERESDGIITRKDIQKISDLDGKKIGVLRASTLDIFAEMLTENYQIKPELVYFRTPMEMAAALNSKAVDALSFYVPSIFNFDENFHILHWYSDDFPKHPCCDIAATQTAIDNKSTQIKNFLNQMKESCNQMNLNPQVGFDVAQTNFRLTEEISRQSIYHTKYIMNLAEAGKDFEKKAIEMMIKKGYIENSVSADDVYFEVLQ